MVHRGPETQFTTFVPCLCSRLNHLPQARLDMLYIDVHVLLYNTAAHCCTLLYNHTSYIGNARLPDSLADSRFKLQVVLPSTWHCLRPMHVPPLPVHDAIPPHTASLDDFAQTKKITYGICLDDVDSILPVLIARVGLPVEVLDTTNNCSTVADTTKHACCHSMHYDSTGSIAATMARNGQLPDNKQTPKLMTAGCSRHGLQA
jgi:hypothetical protein